MKGSVTIKRIHLLNVIQDNRLIFRSKAGKNSKRFAWGRQTAFEDVLSGELSEYNFNDIMQGILDRFSNPWIAAGLDFILEARA